MIQVSDSLTNYVKLLKPQEQDQLLKLTQSALRQRKLWSYYPTLGKLRRELYPRHLEFFAAGGKHTPNSHCSPDCDGSPHRERLMLAANRIGKTEGVGGYELTLHAIGEYPDWWIGRRYDRPVRVWAAGDTSNTVRDIIQTKLLGNVGDFGTGLIPARNLDRVTWKRNVPEAVQDIYVKHISGRMSVLTLKSYDQGRESFQGTEQDMIWLDEEPPMDVYAECLLRTMTTNGMILCTFTPLLGLSEVVLSFLPSGRLPEAAAQTD